MAILIFANYGSSRPQHPNTRHAEFRTNEKTILSWEVARDENRPYNFHFITGN